MNNESIPNSSNLLTIGVNALGGAVIGLTLKKGIENYSEVHTKSPEDISFLKFGFFTVVPIIETIYLVSINDYLKNKKT